MQDLGFEAELVPNRSAESVHWLDLDNDTSDPMHSALMASVRDHYPELLVLPIACPQLASR